MSVLESLLEGRTFKLPSLPVVGLKIIKAVKGEDFSVRDLATIISTDPALAVRTLRMANSALYSPLVKVDSIERAVSMLGAKTLKNLALSFLIIKELNRESTNGFDYEEFWKKSVTSAVAAETLANYCKNKSDDTFVTALLMNVGKVVMYDCRPKEYIKAVNADRNDDDITVVENEVFGFDHQGVGSELLREWGLPQSIYEPIAFHHNVKGASQTLSGACEILKISSLVASIYSGDRSLEMLSLVTDIVKTLPGFERIKVNEFIDEVALKALDVLSIFDIKSGEMKSYSDLMEEANNELSKLNVSYAELVVELEKSKEQSEKLSFELKKANTKLRGMAFKDSITGLFNQRFFHEIMVKEMSRVERHSGCIALIIFDIDKFKDINDTYGHRCGDEILSIVSKVIKGSIRRSDFASRIGGDEFAIILPETGLRSAARLAERLRLDIEQSKITYGETIVGCTVSLGVGLYDPKDGKKTKTAIIDEIDKGLYKSKKSGRNKVTILPPVRTADATGKPE